ncbi:coagulation factor 5/8 type [Actinoplanes sp. NBRC 14428]|uniref:F5/8 type C domain-containing protein n=1 Tax=Pseudosporangium ferrugineum TaxID=439699 RepID=A0A2T0RKH8_9ACTN|nr:discoidin domain-containing protein [Pseudosporangium ferrugineum]PRY21632.1 F5/8 type C domain-containing protein [Pseudosporangium ferrugineum]BCJ49291.1 coagulation factor 5/8 type [Actinoplanes sp. NBRC 14428]
MTSPTLTSPPPRKRRRRQIVLSTVLATALGLTVASVATNASAADTPLSQGKPATASSVENATFTAAAAVDGDAGTRWSSTFADPQWLQVDLGSTQSISQVVLNWEAAYASAFTIQTSANGTSWTNITPVTAGQAGVQTLNVTGSGRYVRMNGTTRATPYGYSLWEFQVFGGGSSPSPSTPGLPTSDNPDFGPNVRIFDPSTSAATIQSAVDQAFNAQLRSPTAQFGTQRHVFLFKPGTYGRVWANVGFYTTLAGLGINPDDVTINGAVNVDSGWNYGDEKNATQNFWRSMENLSIVPEGGTNRWAVSQAAPMRRVHIRGNLTLAPSNQDNGQGYSSGGYLTDSVVDGTVSSGSQQQWYTRDSRIGRWEGGVWNMVYSGVQGAPANAFPNPPHTTLATTPVTREKPYLYVDSAGRYRVFVPALRRNSAGATWPNTAGTSIPMREFYVAKPGDSAARINSALAQGLNLFFTPGTYSLNETIRVTRANTVVTGIGFPTLIPNNGVEALNVADVDGVKVSGLTFDAGTTNSPTLMSVGRAGVHTDHAANPISLQDVFFRIGSSVQGKATTTLAVHSDDTIIDHMWAWRADHGGAPTGWTVNTGDTGLIVNGDDVLATGLFVEHYQKYEVIWNGNRGRTIFFQNEKPYDVPNQAAWMGPRGNGYAAYKVADSVTDHELWGGGVYSFFNVNPSVRVDRGFEVPNRSGVRLRSILTVSLGDVGTIANVVNDTGGPVPNPAGNTVPRNVVAYP